jgi:hypothetical protein
MMGKPMDKLHRNDMQMKAEPETETVQRLAAADSEGAAMPGTYSEQQLRELTRMGNQQAHAAADAGVGGSGGALPHLGRIQAAFGKHDVSGVKAHVGGQATEATAALGATAYAKGGDIAFAGAPDLHTAAHEAAHVVQQRAGVHLKSGIGASGDAYERHADQVADAVVRGDSAEDLLSEVAGSGGSTGVQCSTVQLLGVPLNQELPEGQEEPKYGEYEGEQRRWSKEQYMAMWEEEQGRKLTPKEKETIDRGCIGITANNLMGGGNPLRYALKVYDNFASAHETMVMMNQALDQMKKDPRTAGQVEGKTAVVFAKMFWSNQSNDWEARLKPDKDAFKANPKTHEVDMTGYNYKAQSKYGVDDEGNRTKSSYINFDYGFWDDSSQCFWHANHMDYGDPEDPMVVLQSTKEKFAAGYRDFDRTIYCVAYATNYDPGLAALRHVREN